jgi:hypothetical protein
MTSSTLETNRFEGARRSKPTALQLLFALHRRAAPLLFSSANALNVTTNTTRSSASRSQGEILTYYLVFAAVATAFLLLLRW